MLAVIVVVNMMISTPNDLQLSARVLAFLFTDVSSNIVSTQQILV